ncbi:MAG TPA: sigma-70 family RNA polymerase sigma factor [Candidatus Sulfomarinibacteraceae bacterium]|nr:sigma-70 family RNA polymerase sigma factor [Candidatus Sulfomarinibacteraceae bacterium]
MKQYEQLSDGELVAACRRGDSRGWDALVARYERLVYTIPIRYGLSQSEADDVFQSVWTALLRHLPSLRQPERLSAWLVTTARRECWDRRRGAEHERTRSVAPEEMPEPEATWVETLSPEEIVTRYEQHQALQQALKQLGHRCERLLHYLYKDTSQLSYEEIARRLNMAVGSIGPTRARCLQKLRDLLEKS